jgi:O-antigen/teichoic acid export membrane protein
MLQLIRTVIIAGHSVREHLITFLIAIGGLMLLGGCLYRPIFHPDWTAAEALEYLWPFYLAGTMSVVLGWLVERGE